MKEINLKIKIKQIIRHHSTRQGINYDEHREWIELSRGELNRVTNDIVKLIKKESI